MIKQPEIKKGRFGKVTKIYRFVSDFETTVSKDTTVQTETYVWSACSCLIGDNRPVLQDSIDGYFSYIFDIAKALRLDESNTELVFYFHNLKFDGSFILYHLANNTKFVDVTETGVKPWELKTGQFCYTIADRGGWFNIRIQQSAKVAIVFRDSLKLLPMSIAQMGKGFETKHRKKEMDYSRHDRLGVPVTPEEEEYIKNDVLVLSEALEKFIGEGYYKNTIGANCKEEFKKQFYPENRNRAEDMPDLYKIPAPDYTGAENAGRYIRAAYRGGWCYVKKSIARKNMPGGFVADVNSLYPSMMSSESGNLFPVGKPVFWRGPGIPEEATAPGKYFFIRFKCNFDIKPGHLPFVQLKRIKLFRPTEMQENNINLAVERYPVEITMTCTDWVLFNEFYNISDLEILDGCTFDTASGIFDHYINFYRAQKIQATKDGNKAKRQISKLFLNNLYGQMSTDPDGEKKILKRDTENRLQFETVKEEGSKEAGYIAIGAAITSYARNFTIRAAQENYNIFCYADTDSIHCIGSKENVKGIKTDPVAFCCWKIETEFSIAKFVRQKTYLEYTIKEDGEPVKPYYNIRCAGMPDASKAELIKKLTATGAGVKEPGSYYLDPENEIDLSEFDINLCVGGKLRPKQVKGGTLLVETTFKMRNN